MKKIYFTLVTIIAIVQLSFAQWTTSGSNIYYNTGQVSIGSAIFPSVFSIAGNQTASAWGSAGINFQTIAATYTDSSTPASTTVVNNAVNSFGIPTLGATNTAVTYTNPSTVFIAGAPIAGTNVTETNPYALNVANGNSRFNGNVAITGSNGNLGLALQVVGQISGTQTIQRGIFCNPIFISSATAFGEGIYARADINGALTQAYNIGVFVDNPVINGGGSITSAIGLNIVNINKGSSFNAAIKLANNTGYQLYAGGTAQSYFGGSVGIGTANPGSFMLAVSGNVHAQQVNVDLNGWSDYVFNKNYALPTLTEVKTYIDKNHHLPEIPSEQQIAKDGLNLGEMNKLLVKKVEELTLYLIAKDQKQKVDESEIKKQQEEINLLKQQVRLLIKSSSKN